MTLTRLLCLPFLLAACGFHAVPAAAQEISANPVQPSLRLAASGTPAMLADDGSSFRSMVEPRLLHPRTRLPLPEVFVPWEEDLPHRSPLLAGLMSAVLPGSGEVYSGSYILGGVFAALEAGGWIMAAHYDALGNTRTSDFQQYADAHWSAVKYAEWLNANAKNFEGGENTKPISINPDATLVPWQRVNWEEMNAVEMAIPKFSHRLPHHGDQQYFELIGKYNQYSYGWEDKLDGDYYDISPRFRDYAGQRGRANDAYNTAGTFVNLVVLNHVLSAVDAAWAAARFNKNVKLHSHADLITLPDGHTELVTSARFSWTF